MAVHYRYEVLHDDRDLVVVNKPAGLLTVPIAGTKAFNLLDLINRVVAPRGEKVITVHRIDRYTSGCVVFAKHSIAHKDLVKQFLDHTPIRTYLCLVRGVVAEDQGECVHHLKPIQAGFRNVVVPEGDPEGTRARLTWKVEERLPDTTLLRVNLDTGLKNQIRVQLAAMGHPIVGDRQYAPAEIKETLIDRQALHAWELEFRQPRTGKPVKVRAPWPADFRKLVESCRRLR